MGSDEFTAAMDEFATFHFRGGTRGKQGRSPLRRLLQPFDEQIRAYLDSQFGGICAYTEQPVPTSDALGLAWHRPPSNATGLDGSIHGDHYWWLAFDHRNWYLVAEQTASIKGNSFPVVGARMEPPELSAPRMPRRRPGPLDYGLIIDPCEDPPSFWLRFEADGSVRARRNLLGEDRGAATISALDLDNKDLTTSRSRAVQPVLAALSDFEAFALGEALAEHAAPGTPHAGAIAQLVIRRRIELLPPLGAAEIEAVLHRYRDEFLNEFAESGAELDLHDAGGRQLIVEAAEQAFEALPNEAFGEPFQQLLSEVTSVPLPPVAADIAPEDTIARVEPTDRRRRAINPKTTISPTNRITRIEIKNFRAIAHIELGIEADTIDLLDVLDLEDDERESIVTLSGRRWKMLLGENGSGKSSILHAIALALSGAELEAAMERADLVWDDLLRWGDADGNRPDGRVLIEFTGGETIDLRFDESSHRFWGLGKDAPAIHVNLRGYGAARFPATDRSGTSSDELLARALENPGETSCNIDNLLDSTVPVLNAKAWLGALDDAAFNVAAETISDLLGESSLVRAGGAEGPPAAGQRITRAPIDPQRPTEPRKVLVDGEPLSLVSDGYRSVIALGCEIMAGVGGLTSRSGGSSDMREAIGVVLIDEIGAHLHPRWRMQITGKLRKAFPNVQFFVTTHEPLCLRGLVEREVVRVTKYEEHGVLLDEIDRAPGRYRVDQLLTSEFFGLNSAIDPRVDRLFAEYYELKRKARPSSAQLERLEQLEERINDKALRPVLGYTRRDQLIFEAIDEFLIDDPLDAALPEARRARRNEIVQRVAGIWRRFGDGSP